MTASRLTITSFIAILVTLGAPAAFGRSPARSLDGGTSLLIPVQVVCDRDDQLRPTNCRPAAAQQQNCRLVNNQWLCGSNTQQDQLVPTQPPAPGCTMVNGQWWCGRQFQ